ncbi:MAG: hypothetical protein MRY72_11375 [Aquisalinus sp.]|nr:hypothetical protein [Aquisalinus sp.]
MSSTIKKSFGNGSSFASAIIGGLSASFALFNWIISTFELPVSRIARPLIELYDKTVIWLVDFINIRWDWAVPEWPPRLFALIFILTLLSGRLLVLFDKRDTFSRNKGILPTTIASLALASFLFVPYLRWLPVSVVTSLVLSTLFLIIPGFMGKDDNHDFRGQSYYFLGIISSTTIGLLINHYYS